MKSEVEHLEMFRKIANDVRGPIKWAVLGYARHGKDTIAEMLTHILPGIKFCSSSMFAIDKAVYNVLKDKYNYKTREECFEDRKKHRDEWFNLITAYNKDDPCRLARELLEENDIYVGMRSRDELIACKEKELFDVTIWVNREPLVPKESIESCTVAREDCEYVINNNVSLEQSFKQVIDLVERIIRIHDY